jgi:methylated-DNA-[protein]-cysteine S-methyltransferase
LNSKVDNTYYHSPLGKIEIKADSKGITSIIFVSEIFSPESGRNSMLESCKEQLDSYFNKRLKIFSLELNIQGTDFQKRVLTELINIPYGITISYVELARKIGNEKSVRAVGLANSRNKIAIVIPCHRVIGKDGKLVGYAGGLWRKEWLLNHEMSIAGIKYKSDQMKLF